MNAKLKRTVMASFGMIAAAAALGLAAVTAAPAGHATADSNDPSPTVVVTTV